MRHTWGSPTSEPGKTFDSSSPVVLLLVSWCLFRCIAIGQGVFGLFVVLQRDPHPLLLAVVTGVVVESALVIHRVVTTRQVPSSAAITLDVLVVGAVAFTPLLSVAATPRGFTPWYLMLIASSCTLIAISDLPWSQLAVGIGVLGAAFVVGRVAEDAWPDVASSVFAVSTAGMIFIGTCLVSRYMLVLAERVERAREVNVSMAAAAAVANERAAQRVFLHDTAGLLAMIANTSDPALGAVLRDRARATSRDLRGFVYREREIEASASRSLESIITSSAAEFRDLPLSHNLLTVKNVHLDTDQAGTVASAVRTVLDNVRTHARATAVTVHATSRGGAWELTIRDDGVGFNPAVTPKGFGLRDQVESQCALASISTAIESQIGEGTAVTLRGTATFARELSTPARQEVVTRRNTPSPLARWPRMLVRHNDASTARQISP